MRYRLTTRAAEDLERLYLDGLVTFGRDQADRYAEGLRKALFLVATNPGMARLRTEIVPPVRIHPHGSHLIVYEELVDEVVILRIRHARENWTERPA